ncbi:MAG: DUF86 domain-containing protein [Coriobacteriia bacterium]|nr:DUF86 domain-containing protein [Coriobacteriia bacterium]
MCGRRNEIAYVADMVEACERVMIFASGRSDEDLLDREQPYRGAILHQLTILGEAAKHVDADRRSQWPDIPWADIAGMRDKLVHYYQGIDERIVIWVSRTSVPAILWQLREMLAEMDAE